jgi:clan AA aspartic protease (TIGR02281 family)
MSEEISRCLQWVIVVFATLGFPGVQAEEVPLNREGGVYEVSVKVNGKIELPFVVDTGAGEVLIPEDVALTLIRTGTISKKDFLGKASYQMADGSIAENARLNLRSLQIGTRVLKNVVAAIGPVEGSLLLGQSALELLEPYQIISSRRVFRFGEGAGAPVDDRSKESSVTSMTSGASGTGDKIPIYFAAERAPTSDIPPEAPLCYKFMVSGLEEQLQKLKKKYPGLYHSKIQGRKDGSKTLVVKRKDETGEEVDYFYSTNPSACNAYQQKRLGTGTTVENPTNTANTGELIPIYFAADLAPSNNIPSEAPLCYKFLVAGLEKQLQKLKNKYPELYDFHIKTNNDGSKTLVAKRKDEDGNEIDYFYSTSPRACNEHQRGRLGTGITLDGDVIAAMYWKSPGRGGGGRKGFEAVCALWDNGRQSSLNVL